MTTVSETLNTAADLIEKRGWTQGTPGFYGEGGYCLLGALAGALRVDMDRGRTAFYRGPEFGALANYFDIEADAWGASTRLWAWNDAPGRTAAEVIEVLRAAAVIEAARENESAAAEALL